MHHHFAGFFGHTRGCSGRHGRRHGFGGALAGGFGRGDIGWHGFRAGRKLGAEDLQLLILALLAEKPAHGYEIIKALGERSGGFYSPSPGMVYPALTYLEEIGHASVEPDGTKKLYRITDAGRAYLEANRSAVDTIFAQLKWAGEKMEHVRRAFKDEGVSDDTDADGRGNASIFGDRRSSGFTAELHEARALLKSLLMRLPGASEEEQQRIAAILRRAADEIRGK